jgi:hypothetical protein
MKTFNTTYKATGPTKSSIKVTAEALPSELHKMIVWVMHHQDDAKHLLPEYDKIRQQATDRDEAQKTHCGQDI